MPAFGQETLTRHEAESIEEIVVTAHRPDTLQASALREQLKFALQELLDGIERDEAQMASENPTRSPIRFGYEADRDTGPFIDSEREQVAMSFVRPATILSVGF